MEFVDLAKFQPKQIEAWDALLDPQTKYLLYGGAAGGGKSYFIRWAAVGLSLYYYGKTGLQGVPIGLFSEDYPTLRDRQVTKIAQEFPAYLGEIKETQRDGLAFYVAPKYGGGRILLRNLDDPSKYASVEFAAIFVEELTKNKYETFEDLRTRLRLPGIEERKLVGATNPGQIGHGWVKRKWVKPDLLNADVEQERFVFIPALYTDNQYNPSDYGKQLESISDPQKRKALLEGSWDMFAGQYFEEWSDKQHVIHPFIPEAGALVVGGMDWGRTAPFACVLSTVEKVSSEDSTFYRVKTFAELYGTKKDPSEWNDQITQVLQFYKLTMKDIAWVRGDPAMFGGLQDTSKTIYDMFCDANEEWRGKLRPANNDRIAGWSVLHDWLSIAPDGKPYLQITDTCKNLIRTLPELIHDENRIEDVDSDGEDHAPDALRYSVKHLKWLDGRVGGVRQGEAVRPTKQAELYTAQYVDGKQVGIDTDLFTG